MTKKRGTGRTDMDAQGIRLRYICNLIKIEIKNSTLEAIGPAQDGHRLPRLINTKPPAIISVAKGAATMFAKIEIQEKVLNT